MKKEDLKEVLRLTSADEGKTIVVRIDEPKKVYEPVPLKVAGSILSPLEFITKRKNDYLANAVNVVYSKLKGTIKLTCNENSKFADVVEGHIEMNPELKKFNINSEASTLKLKDLIKLLRFNKWLFVDAGRCDEIVKNLKEFSWTVQQSATKADDQRGNINDTFVQTVNTKAEYKFDASASIFLGTPVCKFNVEIVAAVRERVVEFWFESVEMAELERAQREQLVDDQIKELSKTYVCIETI